MINRLFELSLLLNLTSISVFLGSIGLPSAVVSAGFIAINLLYLGYHWPATSRLFTKRSIIEWMVYLAIWPAVFLVLLALAGAEIDLLTWTKVTLTVTSLVLASALYVVLEGWTRFRQLAMIALGVAAVGFVLHWLAPSLFMRATYSADEPIEFAGRTHGFFSGPNSASQGIVVLTVLITTSLHKVRSRAKLLPIVLMLVLVVATGSRGGMVLGLTMAAVLGWQMRDELRVGRRKFLPGLGVGVLATSAVVMLAVGVLAMGWLGGVLKGGKYHDLGQRIAFWTEVGSTGQVLEDQSLATRLDAQISYVKEIAEQPILGYGAAQGRDKVRAGVFAKTSHNMYLSEAFENGVLYALFLVYLLARLFWTKGSVPHAALLAVAVSNVALVMVISGLATAGVLLVRPIVVALGAALGAKLFPLEVSRRVRPNARADARTGGRNHVRVVALAAGVLLAMSATSASAQFTQYSRPGGGDFAVAGSSTSDKVARAMEESRWTWGKVSVDPWIGVREATYNDNVGRVPDDIENKISDVSVTIGAGLRAYLPGGGGLVWAAHVLPEYVWWQELDQRRNFGGRYGLGLFGNVGRTALELSVNYTDETKFFSREFEDQVATETTLGRAAIDFALGGGFSVFGEGTSRLLRYGQTDEELPALRTVDRDESVGRFMLRNRPRDGFLLGLGAEYSKAEFEEIGNVRDNSGTGVAFETKYLGKDLSILADLVARSLTFENGREGLDYSGLTGHIAFRLVTSPRWQPRIYWVRNLVYSFSESWPYYLDEFVGVGFDGDLTSALTLRLWVESGDSDFVSLEEIGPARVDDLVQTGAELVFRVGPGQLILGGYRTDFDSNLPEFDRTVTIYRFGFVVGERNHLALGLSDTQSLNTAVDIGRDSLAQGTLVEVRFEEE